jgi:uncharacterized membrane protein YhhN
MGKRITVVDGVLIAALLAGVAMLLGRLGPGIWAVMLASSAFVAIALHGVWRERSPVAIALGVGLGFCWLGDVIGYLGHFEVSAGAFLLGHLAFASGFLSRGGDRRRTMRGTWAVALATGLLAAWIMPHVGGLGLRILVVAYMVVISLMVITACGSRLPNSWLLIAAAVLFYVSDIAVARWKFVSPGSDNRFFCYPLYYGACLLLALAPRWCREGTHEHNV